MKVSIEGPKEREIRVGDLVVLTDKTNDSPIYIVTKITNGELLYNVFSLEQSVLVYDQKAYNFKLFQGKVILENE